MIGTDKLRSVREICVEVSNGAGRFVEVRGTPPPTVFNIDVWYWNGCACAMGFAMFSPLMISEGLEAWPGKNNFGEQILFPRFGDEVGMRACATFLEISESDARDLFYISANDLGGPLDVAEKIRNLVDRQERLRSAQQSDVSLIHRRVFSLFVPGPGRILVPKTRRQTSSTIPETRELVPETRELVSL